MINIIPAIDISGGKCVRLTKGDYSRSKTYFDDPVQAASLFEDCGVRRLHLVDLDGAKAASPVNLDVLERIASKTNLEIEFGGGLKSRDSIKSAFGSGAGYAICGSIAVSSPEIFREWIGEFGDRIILGADHRNGFVAVNGWLDDTKTSVESLISIFPGLRTVICTDISRDGMLQGTDAGFYTSMQDRFPETDIIVSGGISSTEDIMALDRLGLRGVIVGKAIYEGRINPEDIKKLIYHAV